MKSVNRSKRGIKSYRKQLRKKGRKDKMRKKRDRKKKNNFLSGEKVRSDKQPKINRKIRNINKSNKKD